MVSQLDMKRAIDPQRVFALFNKGLTQAKIAEKLGITRQRVQQIEKSLGVKRTKKGPKLYERKCKYSGETFFTTKRNQQYKSRENYIAHRRNMYTEEELLKRDEKRREKNRKKASRYYHEVFKRRPDWQKIVKQRNQRAYAAQRSN